MNEELQGVKNELLSAIQELRAEQKVGEARLVGEIKQAVRDSETKLLTAFFRWQENNGIKLQRLKADTGNATREIELRLENVEARLQELEKRYLTGGGGG
jgi:hypothetical protein